MMCQAVQAGTMETGKYTKSFKMAMISESSSLEISLLLSEGLLSGMVVGPRITLRSIGTTGQRGDI